MKLKWFVLKTKLSVTKQNNDMNWNVRFHIDDKDKKGMSYTQTVTVQWINVELVSRMSRAHVWPF